MMVAIFNNSTGDGVKVWGIHDLRKDISEELEADIAAVIRIW